jgi:hypothetical protein
MEVARECNSKLNAQSSSLASRGGALDRPGRVMLLGDEPLALVKFRCVA